MGQVISWFVECPGAQVTVLLSALNEMHNVGTWRMCSLLC